MRFRCRRFPLIIDPFDLKLPGGGIVIASIFLFAPASQAAPTQPGTLQQPLTPSINCATCHAYPNRSERADEAPYAPFAWAGTLMANAARDPVFWAGVAIAHQDAPEQTQSCIRCHAPRAFLESRHTAIAIDELLPNDLDSVNCDTCHRMIDDGVTPAGNALYTIEDSEDPDSPPPKRGPWAYTDATALMHGWSDDTSLLASSRHCGTCHDVTTSTKWLDAEGQPTESGFPEQRTYSEWLRSAFAENPGSESHRTCQDCHMPSVADVAGAKAFEEEGIFHASGARRHLFGGANLFVLDILRAQYGDSGTQEVPDSYFDAAIASNQRQLAQAASLEVTLPEHVDLSRGLESLPIRVTNLSGHKLPTGYSEGRIMWLEITTSYRGSLVYESGRWDESTREISRDDQFRSYEAIAEHAASGKHFHLTKNNRWVVDDRILPRGLSPHPETDPVGDRYQLLPEGVWPHFDDVTFSFPASNIADATPDKDDDDALDVQVRLLYWINTDAYIEFLRDENHTNDAGRNVAERFDALGGSTPIELARFEASIPISGFESTESEDDDEQTSETNDDDATKEQSDSGCSCRSAHSHRSWIAVLVLCAAFAFRKRRQTPVLVS